MSDAISTDLAVVGRVSRARPVSLDATLVAVGARPRGVAPYEGDAVLVELARVYGLRVARIACGLAATVFVLAQLAYVLVPMRTDNEVTVVKLVLWEAPSLVRLLAAFGCVHVIARAAAMRAFARTVGASTDPRACATRLVDRVDRSAIVVGVGGMVTFLIVQLAGVYLFGGGDLRWIQSDETPAWTELDALLYAIPIVAPLVVGWGIAFVAARWRTSVPAWLPLVAAIVAGAILTSMVGFHELPTLRRCIAFDVAVAIVAIGIAAFSVQRRMQEVQS